MLDIKWKLLTLYFLLQYILQAPKIQGKAKDKLASKIKDVSTCASENITEEELLVMKSTSCQV